MGKTRIEWTDYSINPVKGLCPVGCSFCYARRLYKRFKWNPEIRFDQMAFFSLPAKPSRVFVGSTMELFGPWVKPEWLQTILTICQQHNEHTFIFLTKRPRELRSYTWSDNCWIGASATSPLQQAEAYLGLGAAKARVKFISYEPLLTNLYMEPQFLEDAKIGWAIIGQQTPVHKNIPREWVDNLTAAADKARIPVFMKDNLKPLFNGNLRQEWPNG